jgi:hypothetical protein
MLGTSSSHIQAQSEHTNHSCIALICGLQHLKVFQRSFRGLWESVHHTSWSSHRKSLG